MLTHHLSNDLRAISNLNRGNASFPIIGEELNDIVDALPVITQANNFQQEQLNSGAFQELQTLWKHYTKTANPLTLNSHSMGPQTQSSQTHYF